MLLLQPPPEPEPVQQPPEPEPVQQPPEPEPVKQPEPVQQPPEQPAPEQPTVAPLTMTTESSGDKEADTGSNGSGEEAEAVVQAEVEVAPAQPPVWKRGFDIALNTLEQQIKELEVMDVFEAFKILTS